MTATTLSPSLLRSLHERLRDHLEAARIRSEFNLAMSDMRLREMAMTQLRIQDPFQD